MLAMIQIEPVDRIPELDWCDFAREDFDALGWTRAVQTAKIERMWLLRGDAGVPLAVVGVYSTSALAQRNELFGLFTREFTEQHRRYVRGMVRGLRVLSGLYPNLIVVASCGRNSRFAAFFRLRYLFTSDNNDVYGVP